MNYVNQFLNFISDGLLLPAVTLEIILLFWALWSAGAFAKEYWSRLRTTASIREFVNGVDPQRAGQWAEAASQLPQGAFRETVLDLNSISKDRRVANHRINAYETACNKELDRARLMARLGPILGLMGTLIPKGHALGQLALGDVSAMTQNLQVAFANTVVGLFIGAIGFVIQQGRQRWYKQELDALEYLSDLMFGEYRREA
jgi:biopolymer transport protein ExbB/TolQ